MSKYYVVLTGQLKNAGDYLITAKCRELLKKERPDHDLVQYGRWESLEDKLDVINQSQALILMGGPAVAPDFYPNIYKLTKNLDDIKVPIVPMAVGWNNKKPNFDGMLEFSFNQQSLPLLKRFAQNGVGISVRDSYTASILRRQGLDNVYLTGCASWYSPADFNQYIDRDYQVKSIAITPAQDARYANLSKQLMKKVQEIYPQADIVVAFHRGIGKIDDHTDADDARNTADLAEFAQSLGMRVEDLSYSFDHYQKYDDIDMHIGFRVHGHLYFLSHRKPSILVNEDGRGKAMCETIGLAGVDAFNITPLKKWGTAINIAMRKAKLPARFYAGVNKQAIQQIEHLIRTHQANDYQLMNGALKNIDSNYAIMKEFLNNLPE